MLTLTDRFQRFQPFMAEAQFGQARVRQVYGAGDAGAVMSETDQRDAGNALALLAEANQAEYQAEMERGTLARRSELRPAKAPPSPARVDTLPAGQVPMALRFLRGEATRGTPLAVGRAVVSKSVGRELLGTFCSHPVYPQTAAGVCLDRIARVWQGVYDAGGPAPYCNPRDPMTCGKAPWKEMPANGKRFQKTGSLVNPGVEAVDFPVLTFRVPNAWDGVIITTTNQWDGAGFVDGSGDLRWRVMVDNQWLKDLQDIRITLGRLESPYELEGAGYRLLTNQTVRYFVQLGPGALGRLAPTGRITCACSGWFYPRS